MMPEEDVIDETVEAHDVKNGNEPIPCEGCGAIVPVCGIIVDGMTGREYCGHCYATKGAMNYAT